MRSGLGLSYFFFSIVPLRLWYSEQPARAHGFNTKISVENIQNIMLISLEIRSFDLILGFGTKISFKIPA